MGFPFLTGFYSKDALLELTYGVYQTKGLFSYWLGTLSAFFTSFYSIRLLYLTFLGKNNSYKVIINNAHESSLILLIPLYILCFGSIFIGYFFKELFLGMNVDTWNNTFFVLPWHFNNINSEFLPFYIKLIPVIFSITGGLTSYFLYAIFYKIFNNNEFYNKNYHFYKFLSNKWYFDKIYNQFIVKNLLNFSYYTSFKTIDRGVIEILGPFGITLIIKKLSNFFSKLQTGLIYHYIFLIILGVTFILFLMLLPYIYNISLFLVFIYLFLYQYNNNL